MKLDLIKIYDKDGLVDEIMMDEPIYIKYAGKIIYAKKGTLHNLVQK